MRRRPARVRGERWVGSGLRDGAILLGGVPLRHGSLDAVPLRAVPLGLVTLGLVTLGVVPLRLVPLRAAVAMGPMRLV
eukprot:scaffold17881_cov24-Phaeocystis_antarctica.AAC.1